MNTKWTGKIEDTSLFEFWLKLKNSSIVENEEVLGYNNNNNTEKVS